MHTHINTIHIIHTFSDIAAKSERLENIKAIVHTYVHTYIHTFSDIAAKSERLENIKAIVHTYMHTCIHTYTHFQT